MCLTIFLYISAEEQKVHKNLKRARIKKLISMKPANGEDTIENIDDDARNQQTNTYAGFFLKKVQKTDFSTESYLICLALKKEP